MKSTKVQDAREIQLPVFNDVRGNLSFVQNDGYLPFNFKRLYYLYDVPSQASRAAHGHKKLEQFFLCLSGSFNLQLDDGYEKRNINMSIPNQGIYLPPGLWRDVTGFSSGAVCVVLASDFYDEEDYIRDYNEFLQYKGLK